MITQYSEGGGESLKQLVSLATIMKREYSKALADKKKLKEQQGKLKTAYDRYKYDYEKAVKDLEETKSSLEEANSSLSKIEDENNQNRRKIAHLRAALKHNITDGNESFVKALNEESPNVAYTPPRSSGSSETPLRRGLCDTSEIASTSTPCAPSTSTPSVPSTPDLFDSPESDDVENHQMHFPGQKLKLFTSLGKNHSAKKARTHEEEYFPPNPLLINYKKGSFLSRSNVPSVKRHDYDGFGGSTTFVQPIGPPKSSYLSAKGIKNKKVVRNKNIKAPVNQPKISNTLKMYSSSPYVTIKSDKTSEDSASLSKAEDKWQNPFAKKKDNESTSKVKTMPKLSCDSSGFVDLT